MSEPTYDSEGQVALVTGASVLLADINEDALARQPTT